MIVTSITMKLTYHSEILLEGFLIFFSVRPLIDDDSIKKGISKILLGVDEEWECDLLTPTRKSYVNKNLGSIKIKE